MFDSDLWWCSLHGGVERCAIVQVLHGSAGATEAAIKMAPVVKALEASALLKSVVCITGQHREMLDQVMSLFELKADHDLAVMQPGQTLSDITVRILRRIGDVLEEERPDYMLVHGDTTTALSASLAAFYAGVKVGHVEAGLRSHDLRRPWPEEMNRCVVDRIASLMFAPTRGAEANLLREGLSPSGIHVTGNTVIDALLSVSQRIDQDANLRGHIARSFGHVDFSRHVILVTGHRRESFGEGFENICHALADVAKRGDTEVIYPVHLNPNVQDPVKRILGGIEHIHLIEPQSYASFVYLLKQTTIVLTDSGGIQEEAPTLGKPVLVMREVTERPEAVEAGTVELVGAHRSRIVSAINSLLDDPVRLARFSRAHNPYGDGRAAGRIAGVLGQLRR